MCVCVCVCVCVWCPHKCKYRWGSKVFIEILSLTHLCLDILRQGFSLTLLAGLASELQESACLSFPHTLTHTHTHTHTPSLRLKDAHHTQISLGSGALKSGPQVCALGPSASTAQRSLLSKKNVINTYVKTDKHFTNDISLALNFIQTSPKLTISFN